MRKPVYKVFSELDPECLAEEARDKRIAHKMRQSEIARGEREPDPESPLEDSARQQHDGQGKIKGRN